MTNPYASTAWRNIRRRVLIRDHHECQLRYPGCTTMATEVHHLDPPSEGGALYPPADRLAAVCKSCNVAERNERIAANSRAHQGAVTSVRERGDTRRPWCDPGPCSAGESCRLWPACAR